MIISLREEMILRKSYLSNPIQTIYFGGGTPSLLSAQQLEFLMNAVRENFIVNENAEVTLEANPEDLIEKKTIELKKLGINRLSIGIQTFQNSHLKWMNRIHDQNQVYSAFQNARNAGFDNISLDLIYALPDGLNNHWESDLQKVVELSPEHISLYGLTIESKTVFGRWEEKGRLIQVPEDEAAKQYLFAIDFLREEGYEHYEVSNFGKPDFASRHNSSYWAGVSYLGIGPGAHSFDGHSRQINVSNNTKYIRAIHSQSKFYETEQLTSTQRLNEQILTGLRTRNGLDVERIEKDFGVDLKEKYSTLWDNLSSQNLITVTSSTVSLTSSGFLVADEIALQMFFPE